MAYSHAVLGESLELCRQAAEWGRDEQKRLQKNEQARVKITAIIDELKKREKDQKQEKTNENKSLDQTN